jgi:hypothetical protein
LNGIAVKLSNAPAAQVGNLGVVEVRLDVFGGHGTLGRMQAEHRHQVAQQRVSPGPGQLDIVDPKN